MKCFGLSVVLLVFATPILADEIRLTNGDLVAGQVKSLDEQSLILVSENFGELKIARAKIATISLGKQAAIASPTEVLPKADVRQQASDQQSDLLNAEHGKLLANLARIERRLLEDTGVSSDQKTATFRERDLTRELINKNRAEHESLQKSQVKDANDKLVEQLRGLDPSYMKAVEQAFPLLNSSPDAKKYFNDRVGGLISGTVKLDDVRSDAKKVVAELEDLKSDLGPGTGAALDGYLGILKKFLNETDPEANKKVVEPQPTPE